MSKQLQGWIDDPNDPWVGFVIDNVPPICDERIKDKFPLLVRVKPTPLPNTDARVLYIGAPVFEVHPDDIDRVWGQYLHVKTPMYVGLDHGRFVE